VHRGARDPHDVWQDEARFLQAAADCLDFAQTTKDAQMRTALVALALQWLNLAQDSSEDSALMAAGKAFSDWQQQKEFKKQ
jgi:hypothetical protein